MTAHELGAIQTPIKENYRSHPDNAMVALHGYAELGKDIKCSIQIDKARIETGLHPAVGGGKANICPGTVFLDSLAACTGVTMGAVATHMGLVVRSARIRADGDLDLRGTLGISEEVPVGFQEIRIEIELDADGSKDQLDTLVELTERYCVVFQTLSALPRLHMSFRNKNSMK